MIVNYLHKFGEAYTSHNLVLEAMKLEHFPRDCYRFMEHFGPLNPLPLKSISVCHNKVCIFVLSVSLYVCSVCLFFLVLFCLAH